MSKGNRQPASNVSTTLPLIVTVVSAVALFVLLGFTSKVGEYELLSFLLPFENYISVAVVFILGHITVQFGTKWIYGVVQRQMDADAARSMRVIARLIGYGLIFSFLVSVLTDNAAAALTLGSFAGLVAGFASQTVMGQTVAGIFLALFRPIGIGERVSIGSNSGVVVDITLMHLVLDAEDRHILIPSATVAKSILVKHKEAE